MLPCKLRHSHDLTQSEKNGTQWGNIFLCPWFPTVQQGRSHEQEEVKKKKKKTTRKKQEGQALQTFSKSEDQVQGLHA